MTTPHPGSKRNLPPEAAELAEQLRVWRESRVPRQRIPESFWQSASALARQHGVSSISRALGLPYYGLRRHTFPENGTRTPKPPVFVELAHPAIPPMTSVPQPWTVELHQPSGSKLTLRLPHATAKELLPLVQTFLRS